MFDVVEKALLSEYGFTDKDDTRKFFMDLQQTFIDWNDKPFGSDEFDSVRKSLVAKIEGAAKE